MYTSLKQICSAPKWKKKVVVFFPFFFHSDHKAPGDPENPGRVTSGHAPEPSRPHGKAKRWLLGSVQGLCPGLVPAELSCPSVRSATPGPPVHTRPHFILDGSPVREAGHFLSCHRRQTRETKKRACPVRWATPFIVYGKPHAVIHS